MFGKGFDTELIEERFRKAGFNPEQIRVAVNATRGLLAHQFKEVMVPIAIAGLGFFSTIVVVAVNVYWDRAAIDRVNQTAQAIKAYERVLQELVSPNEDNVFIPVVLYASDDVLHDMAAVKREVEENGGNFSSNAELTAAFLSMVSHMKENITGDSFDASPLKEDVASLLFPRAPAAATTSIMADRLLLQVERLLAAGDPGAALEAMNEILALQEEHDLVLDEVFREALELLDSAELLREEGEG